MRPQTCCPIVIAVAALVAGCESDSRSPLSATPSASTDAAFTQGTNQLGGPIDGLTSVERTEFRLGQAIFDSVFTPKTGLGPLFNAPSCATCHTGNGGASATKEIHGTLVLANGMCDELDSVGGFVFQDSATPQLTAATGFTKEPIPAYAMLGHVTTPQLFGRGLLEAISDETLRDLAEQERQSDPRAAGRIALLSDGTIGRFGRKDQASTLLDFNSDAFLYEIGITTPTDDSVDGPIGPFPVPPGVDLAKDPELSLVKLNQTTDFVRFLAPPTSRSDPVEDQTFKRLGCATCHVPSLQTGPSPSRALSQQTVRAFTDLLLHDMGPGLADICLGAATPAEFRTEPLMGLRLRTVYLHDGRTTNLETAIRLHGGQATDARNRFDALSSTQRANLLRYLKTL